MRKASVGVFSTAGVPTGLRARGKDMLILVGIATSGDFDS